MERMKNISIKSFLNYNKSVVPGLNRVFKSFAYGTTERIAHSCIKFSRRNTKILHDTAKIGNSFGN